MGGRQHAFGLLNPDPAGQCLAQPGYLEVMRLASSTPVWTSSAVRVAKAPSAITSSADHARGWVAYTKVPTG